MTRPRVVIVGLGDTGVPAPGAHRGLGLAGIRLLQRLITRQGIYGGVRGQSSQRQNG